MLYPVATVSYPLGVTLGLPFNAPFQDAMQFYAYSYTMVQLSVTIPFAVPAGHVIRLVITNGYFYTGATYANFHSLAYTPRYEYDANYVGYVVMIS